MLTTKEGSTHMEEKDINYEWPGPDLHEEQKAAVRAIMFGGSPVTVLTGCAGSGKSTVIQFLLHHFPYMFQVAATTGRAAVNVGGVTVDSMFRMRRSNWSYDENSLGSVMDSLPDTLIIDEASMIGKKMAEIIYVAVEMFDKRLVLVGDWAQASPVKDQWPTQDTPLFDGAHIINLRQCHRQTDRAFLDRLNKLRRGDPVDFRDLVTREEPSDDHVRLTATNASANVYNDERVLKFAKESGNAPFKLDVDLVDGYTASEQDIIKEADNFRIAHDDIFCEGCRVMLTRNAQSKAYVNGDTGDLISLDDEMGEMKVFLDRTESVVTIPIARFEVRRMNRSGEFYTLFALDGYPVKRGYAMTIHKSQGATIPKVWVDIASLGRMPNIHGLAYVAMSRVPDSSGLMLNDWLTHYSHVDPSIEWLVHPE